MTRRLAALLLLLPLLAACGPGNTDPRKGEVTTARSDCLFGSCYRQWMICRGPDLITYYDGDKSWTYTSKNDRRCAP